jgi:penicillin-binding protein 2
MEKYLNDTIATDRLSEVERISKADLIPVAIKDWYVKKETQRQAKLILEAEAAKAEMNAESKQNSSEEEDSSCDDESDETNEYEDESNQYAFINNFPVQLICLEKCDGT